MAEAMQSAFGHQRQELNAANLTRVTVTITVGVNRQVSVKPMPKAAADCQPRITMSRDLGLASGGAASASNGPTGRCRCCGKSASASPRISRSRANGWAPACTSPAETANLLRALKAGGAEVFCCASNPLSTQDDVAAALVAEYGIPTYAIHGEDRDTYYSHLRAVLDRHPTITMDDGADLVSLLHTEFKEQAAEEVRASMEETTTGVIRLRAMEKDGALKIPVVAVNDAQTKHLFDNRYGTGQSTLDGDHPRDRRADRGLDRRGRGLRMVRARRRVARARPGRQT